MPWHRTGASSILPKNVATGNAYNGINVVALWATALERAYTHSLWGTYKQFQSQGSQVRKGEKASLVVFYKEFDVDPDPKDENDDGRRHVAKASWVFNVSQVDGYPSSQVGDFSDVKVVSPFGAIAWRDVSRLNDDEMKALMIDVVNQCYGFFSELFAGPSDLPRQFRTNHYLRDCPLIRREACASRSFRTSRLL